MKILKKWEKKLSPWREFVKSILYKNYICLCICSPLIKFLKFPLFLAITFATYIFDQIFFFSFLCFWLHLHIFDCIFSFRVNIILNLILCDYIFLKIKLGNYIYIHFPPTCVFIFSFSLLAFNYYHFKNFNQITV